MHAKILKKNDRNHNFELLLLGQLFFSPIAALITSWMLLVKWNACEVGVNSGANFLGILFFHFPLLTLVFFAISVGTHLLVWKKFKITGYALLSIIFWEYIILILGANIWDSLHLVLTGYPVICDLTKNTF